MVLRANKRYLKIFCEGKFVSDERNLWNKNPALDLRLVRIPSVNSVSIYMIFSRL